MPGTPPQGGVKEPPHLAPLNVEDQQLYYKLLPVLPQQSVLKEEDFCSQQMNFRDEQPEPPQIKKELQKPNPSHIEEQLKEREPPQIKEEQQGLRISQNKELLDLKQETNNFMDIPTYEENDLSEADPQNLQSFNVTDSQDEEGSQHEELTLNTDGETNPQRRDPRKRKERSHIQNVDDSHMSESVTLTLEKISLST